MVIHIESLEYDARSQLFTVKTDRKCEYKLTYEQLESLSLSSDRSYPESIAEEIERLSEFNEAYRIAARYASRSPRCTQEVRNRLRIKGFFEKTIEDVIDRLVEIGLIDDMEYIKLFVKDKSELNRYSRKRIRFELIRLQFSSECIETALEQLTQSSDEENALRLAEQKLGHQERNDRQKAKLFRYLVGRGFEYETVNRALERMGF